MHNVLQAHIVWGKYRHTTIDASIRPTPYLSIQTLFRSGRRGGEFKGTDGRRTLRSHLGIGAQLRGPGRCLLRGWNIWAQIWAGTRERALHVGETAWGNDNVCARQSIPCAFGACWSQSFPNIYRAASRPRLNSHSLRGVNVGEMKEYCGQVENKCGPWQRRTVHWRSVRTGAIHCASCPWWLWFQGHACSSVTGRQSITESNWRAAERQGATAMAILNGQRAKR
jgi:hypothetical protein